MNEQTEKRIYAARIEVSKSTLEPEHKDNLHAFLDHAELCANGTPDKIGAIGAAVADMIVRDARREVREEQRVSRAIDVHVARCPRAAAPKTPREWLGRMLADYPVLVLILVLWAVDRFGIGAIIKLFC